MPSYASTQDIFDAVERLTPDERVAIWRSASRFLVGTRFSGPADLFYETVDRLLQGRRHWPLSLDFCVYLHGAMESVAGTDRQRHENALRSRAPLEDMLDCARDGALRTESVLERLLRQERVEVAARAADEARRSLEGDPNAQRVIDGWIAGLSPGEICLAYLMSDSAYDAARKRALRAIHKLVGPRAD